MANLVYSSGLRALLREGVENRKFYVLLATNGYTPNTATHVYRSSVTNELPGEGGYAVGGRPVTVTVAAAGDDTDIVFSTVDFPSLTADDIAWAVIYMTANPSTPAKDQLILAIDIGTPLDLVSETLTLEAATLRVTNPAVS